MSFYEGVSQMRRTPMATLEVSVRRQARATAERLGYSIISDLMLDNVIDHAEIHRRSVEDVLNMIFAANIRFGFDIAKSKPKSKVNWKKEGF